MDERSSLPCAANAQWNRCLPHALHDIACSRTMPLLLFGLVLTALSGCVERRMTIRTHVDNQGGALVYIDNEEVGPSPVSTGFTYYADREIKLVKDGYESVTLIQPIRAPWWDSLFLEFFTENLWPLTLRDERQFQYNMPPAVSVSTGEVIQRGQQLRTEAQQGAEFAPGVRPAGAAAPLNF
jgi:hypothetical protein